MTGNFRMRWRVIFDWKFQNENVVPTVGLQGNLVRIEFKLDGAEIVLKFTEEQIRWFMTCLGEQADLLASRRESVVPAPVRVSDQKVDAEASFDPFAKLAGKKILRASHVKSGELKHVAFIDFEDGTSLTFRFSETVYLHGESGNQKIFSFTPLGSQFP